MVRFLLFAFVALYAKGQSVDPWMPFQFLIGDWTADGGGCSFHFDLDRKSSAHLAFGAGLHACLGQNLARADIRVLMTTGRALSLPAALRELGAKWWQLDLPHGMLLVR